MFVFPANDDGYRKRKKSFKACEQCKKGRRRCQSSSKIKNGQCVKCARDNRHCSLMVETDENQESSKIGESTGAKEAESTAGKVPVGSTSVYSSVPYVSTIDAGPVVSSVGNSDSISRLMGPPSTALGATQTQDVVSKPLQSTTGRQQRSNIPRVSLINGLDDAKRASAQAVDLGIQVPTSKDPTRASTSNIGTVCTSATFASHVTSTSSTASITSTQAARLTPTITSISAVVNPSDAEILPPAEAVPADPDAPRTTARRFISNLDPKSDLVMAGDPDKDKTGIWVMETVDIEDHSSRRPIVVPPVMNNHLLVYLNSVHAFEVPAEPDRNGLLNIYFKYINAVLPIVDPSEFWKLYNQNEHSTLLLHSIMLAACRHSQAISFLQSKEPRNFAAVVHRKISALLYSEIESDPLILTRVYALLSLHSEGSQGIHQSAKDLVTAFNYAHMLGIHLRGHDTNIKNTDLIPTPRQKLWYSLWCLDRMVSCVAGRPLISHPRDVGQWLETTSKETTVLSKTIDSCKDLDSTIDLYRPHAILSETVLPEAILRTINFDSGVEMAIPRLVRYVAELLSYKRIKDLSGAKTPQSTLEAMRRTAFNILTVVEQTPDMAPFPIIPYSVSLTLTAFLHLYPSADARNGWQRGLLLLDSLGKYWWVAEAMNSMGRSVFRKLEEDYNALEGQLDIEAQLTEIFSAPSSSVLDQASLFGELDKDVVDYWFPNIAGLDWASNGSSVSSPFTAITSVGSSSSGNASTL
ncbi:hypothetical protein V1511DRAFT_491979 [Dipodascopsis uninucleata]